MTQIANYFPEFEQDLPARKMDLCGKEPITWHERRDNQKGKPIYGSFVEFINNGQTLVWLNESIPIMPAGGNYALANPCFNAKWEFAALVNPPAVNSFICMAGNHLQIIVHKNRGTVASIQQPPGTAIAGQLSIGLTDVNLTPFNNTIDTDFTVPAEAVYLKIRNVGGLAPAPITVNGNEITPGGIFERQQFFDGVNRYILPEYVVITNGSLVEYYYEINPLI